MSPAERRRAESALLNLEQQREFLIRSAENHEVTAADMRGKADYISAIIDALKRDLDG